MDGVLWLDECASTQDVAAEIVRADQRDVWAVGTDHQTHGRGRFSREWFGAKGASLAATFIAWKQEGNPSAWVVGMALAAATAREFEVNVRWPNDIVKDGKKLGGVLTELAASSQGSAIPVIGIGLNLTANAIPPNLAGRASDLCTMTQANFEPKAAYERLCAAYLTISSIREWKEIADAWGALAENTSQTYQLPDGRVGSAIGIGDRGQLIVEIEGQCVEVWAADAWFGPEPSVGR